MEESDFDSACSTPYVSAPSSPGRSSAASAAGGGYFYSAPASPMHFFLSSAAAAVKPSPAAASSVEFEFTVGSMSSADELFLNGQIRPMKLSSHLQRPQTLAPLLDLDESESTRDETPRGREFSCQNRRRARSLSPLRNSMTWHRIKDNDDNDKCDIKEEKDEDEEEEEMIAASMSASSSRSSSGGRSSKRWILLKEFLYRSKSEGRNNNNNNNSNNNNNISNGNKFWNSFSFSPAKAKKAASPAVEVPVKAKKAAPTNGVGKRPSAHEMHYKAKRAQAEEMRKKTFLPYRQGLIGCLGFSSKGYGAVSGLARALNPTVSSR